MSSDDNKCDVNNETYNLRNSLNVPCHGVVPKWLEDMSDTVIQNRPSNNSNPFKKAHYVLDLNTFSEKSSNIPSKIPWELENRNTAPKLTKFGRRSSLTNQVYLRNMPRYTMISKSDYLVPQLEGKIDFAALHDDIKQADLERSWKSLNVFQQTHKGRLDSAKNGMSNTAFDNWNATLPSIDSTSVIETTNYSPSFLGSDTPPLRSKSEMSNYVPSYVYTKIKKATESQENPFDTLNVDTNSSFDNLSLSKAKSSENIFNAPAPNVSNLSHSFTTFRGQHFQQSTIEKHLNEYKLRVDQENRLREKIINELLNENERITERLKHKNTRNKQPDKRRFSKTPSFEDVSLRKLYNKNSKYRNLPKDEESNDNSEKENLIECFVEGGDSAFVIPELPRGRTLRIDILSTWGDKHYVGLNGIEVFGSNGKIVDVKRIAASPADVNILPENRNDPRIVRNLLDGVNRTQDDVHLWLAPFEKGSEHTITIEFQVSATVAMIRIWNYNKSRIHSFRGAKDVIITLDEVPVFKGEIAKACGGILGGVDAFGDTILFTTDEAILEVISHNDKSYSTLTARSKPDTPATTERPPTVATMTNRPYTGAPLQKELVNDSVTLKDQILLGAHRVDIVLLSNWGYANIIGLAGLEIIGVSDSPIFITEENISCNSKIKTVNLKALINEENVTTELGDMWWIPYRSGQEAFITVQFKDFMYISGLRIWNYNQSPETTYAGVRTIKILLDGKPVLNHLTKDEVFLLRRAPGNTHYDFVQDIHFAESATPKNSLTINPTFNTLSLYRNEMPEGFVFEFIIFSTWGDQYYCGLNELELYNEFGEKVTLEEQNICAYPESINVLPDVSGDIRTPDKLIDGVMSDDEGAHSWLAPIIPKCLNRIYIVLDQPITVSLIKLWNYSKNPTRGIKEFGVLVDDLLVYNGILDKHTKKKGAPSYRSILFTDDKSVVEREIHTFIRNSSHMQEVILLDDNRTTTGGSLPNPDQTLRPFTSVSPFDRGYITQ